MSQTPTTVPSALPNEIFLGSAALNPMAIKIMFQNANKSNIVSSVTSHFGESSERNAPPLDATRCSRSTVDGSLMKRIKIPSSAPIIPGTQEYDTIASDGTNFIFVPCIRLNASISTAPTTTAAMNGTSTSTT